MKTQPLDLKELRVFPLAERKSLTRVEQVVVDPDSPAPRVSAEAALALDRCAAQVRAAKARGAAVIIIYGAHLLRNGAAAILERMMAAGLIDHLATNGAGSIPRRAIGEALHARFRAVYAQTAYQGPFAVDPASVGRRALRNACLAYLMAADEADGIALAQAQIAADTTMTESLTALALLVDTASPARDTALAAFHARFQDDALVIDKFFAVQAMSSAPDTLAPIDALTRHPDFDIRNPNRYRSLVSAFGYRNPLWFHDASGAGYDFVARMTLAADKVNRSVAARGMEVFADWKRYDPARQEKMRAALDRILAANDLSANTREMAERVRKG